jgi:hypothetical protein
VPLLALASFLMHGSRQQTKRLHSFRCRPVLRILAHKNLCGILIKDSEMKRLMMVAALAGAFGLSGCTAHFTAMMAPEARQEGSKFEPYKDDDGASMFRYTVGYFSKKDKAAQQAKAQAWLGEWLSEMNYCKRGYEIVKKDFQPWPHAFLDPVDIGGTIIAIGRCKTSS